MGLDERKKKKKKEASTMHQSLPGWGDAKSAYTAPPPAPPSVHTSILVRLLGASYLCLSN